VEIPAANGSVPEDYAVAVVAHQARNGEVVRQVATAITEMIVGTCFVTNLTFFNSRASREKIVRPVKNWNMCRKHGSLLFIELP
jgi:hypothetical protein